VNPKVEFKKKFVAPRRAELCGILKNDESPHCLPPMDYDCLNGDYPATLARVS
jgi:hypothetical protein